MPDDLIVMSFDSPLDLLEWSVTAPVIWKGELESHGISHEKSEWTGTKDFEEAYNLAKFGWPEGLKLLTEQTMLADIALAEKPTTGRKKRRSFTGYWPDIPRAVAGEMPDMTERLKPKRTGADNLVKIRYDLGRLSHVSPETIIRLGGAVCSYINMLEASNYTVQLEAYFETVPSNGYGGPNVSFRFPMKKAGTPLAMIDMVFWLAHPSALRRIKFAAMERLDIEDTYSPGYGRSQCVTEPPPDTLYLRIEDAGSTVKECLENIREKHMALLKPQAPLATQLKTLEFA